MNIFTKKLTPNEYSELAKGFNRYIKSNHNGKMRFEIRSDIVKEITNKYLDVFVFNPQVKEKLEKSSKQTKDYFTYNRNDITNLFTIRSDDDYRERRNCVEALKARFIIFCLEVEGCYQRPQITGKNILHSAMMTEVFFDGADTSLNEGSLSCMDGITKSPGRFREEFVSELCGTYLLYRLSFNNSFPNHVAAHTLKIYKDDEDPDIISYSTLNTYKQFQSEDDSSGIQRTRVSHGNVYNYQGQIFLLGAIKYSHLETFERREIKYNYPEVIMLHPHGGDMKNLRGIMLGHFPYLSLPVSTRVYMTKLDNHTSQQLDDIENTNFGDMSDQQILLLASHCGNIHPEFKLQEPKEESFHDENGGVVKKDFNKAKIVFKGQQELQHKVSPIIHFIKNEIETSYSQMLTP